MQTFIEYMAQFMQDKKAQDVVEIGSDIQLKLAVNLAPYCKTFYSVNFAHDHAMMRGWLDMHRKMADVDNIALLSGNAVNLPSMIAHADIILLRSVLIDGRNGIDTHLMWRYRRGEEPCTDELWAGLVSRFDKAELDAYKGFLKVAKPGHIVAFESPENGKTLNDMLVGKLGVEPAHIQVKELSYDDGSEIWNAYIIENP
jgi:hypothetical protein